MNLIFSALFILAMGACGSGGGCTGCSAAQPLPGGALPAGQTIEGGAQLRVTPHGIGALAAVVRPLIERQLAAGVCLPAGAVIGGVVSYCQGNQGTCRNGCKVSPALNSLSLGENPANPRSLRAHLDARATGTVPLHILIGTCNVNVTVDHLVADLDVALDIDDASGELGVHADPIANLSIPNSGIHLSSSGVVCDAITGIAGIVVDLLNGTLTSAIRDLLSPALASIIRTLVPIPLGLAGIVDVGALLHGVSPATEARMETRILPGGYAFMQGGGLSLGVITGINADANPATRTGALASEAVRCVPALPAPDLGAAPASLPTTPRGSYRLDVANEFNGVPSDPQADVAIGVSETMLELAGHHLVTSGALCLGIGTSFVPQLNLGTLGLLVRSLGDLGSATGNDPLLLVTRPQRALEFSIGDNTVASPAITIGIEHLEVDFYAFLFERYVRAFTLDLTLDVGINLDLDQPDGQPAKIRPTLVGIEPANVQIKVLDSEFVRESPELLEAVLPSVFSLVTPLLGSLPEIAVPAFAGIRLDQLSIHHVTTNQDDFLAIYGSLDPSSVLSPLGLEAAPRAPRALSTGRARLASVTTPDIDRVRGALMHEAGGALPRVTFDVDPVDAAGRELEWSYQLDHGLWRPWRSAAPLVIEDRAFAWQGKYTIGLRSRVKDDYHTVGAAIQVPVIIDSVAPRIAVDQAAWHGDRYEIPAFDIVSGGALQYAFGAPGSAAPASAWSSGATIAIARDAAAAYAGDGGQLAVFVRDEAGNTAIAVAWPFHGDAGGCACDARGAPGAGSLMLVVVVGGLVLGRRRSRATPRVRRGPRAIATTALWVGGALSLGCGHDKPPAGPGGPCERDTDCGLPCPSTQRNFCVDHTCMCSTSVPAGRIGPYSDVAVGLDGTIWVSAYAQSYGDLVVAHASAGRIPDEAWEWVDGVPEGPVTVTDTAIRRGVTEPGPDVGMYTSIAVAPDGTPLVSYFDRDAASLKLAQKINGAWQTHVVDAGTGLGDQTRLVGMYSSLTLRSDDGRPGIAYLAHVIDATGGHAEVRFASAQVPHPSTAGDWQTWVVDTAPLPPTDAAHPAQYPLPEGLGLFIDSARMPNQAPVVTYYDRVGGDLKLARFNVQSGQFSPARVLDGSHGVDAGWSPSLAIDAQGVARVAYVGATAHDFKYITDAPDAQPQVIDDGYRVVGQTVDGLPRPELHFVGDDAGIVLPPGGGPPLVVYQDATTQELLIAQQQPDGSWHHTSIAGATDPWPGGYGFFAAAALGADQLVMSTWVIDLPDPESRDANWVEVFTRPIAATSRDPAAPSDAVR